MTEADRKLLQDLCTRLNMEDILEVFYEEDVKEALEAGKTEEEVQDILVQQAYMAEGVRDMLRAEF